MKSWLKSIANLAAECRDALEEYRVHKLCEELQGNVVRSLVQVQECRLDNRPVRWKMAVPDEECSPYLPFLKRSPSFQQRLGEAFNPFLALLLKDRELSVTVDGRMRVKSGFFGTGHREYILVKLESKQA
jgi:hypothetical protein